MEKRHVYRHCLEQVDYLLSLIEKPQLTQREAVILLSQSASQGFIAFPKILSSIGKNFPNPQAHSFIKQKQQLWRTVHEIKNLKKNFLNNALVGSLYALDSPYFERGTRFPEKLLIVFTTTFNQFGLSNLVFLSLLQELGISLLFLKDSSVFHYLNGIPGYGEDYESSVVSIREFIEQEKFENVYISGYSSGGFASLLMSTQIPCDGYLGFSIMTDLSPTSKGRSKRLIKEEALQTIPKNLLVDIGKILDQEDGSTQRRIFYGSESPRDRLHSLHVASAPNMKTTEIEGCGHRTPQALLVEKKLLNEFELMIF